MKSTVEITIAINASRSDVWKAMLGSDTYKRWTAPFCEGTYYEGSWDKGSRILFLAPNGDGMVAEIVESKAPEFVSIRHLGEIKNGVEDTSSESVRAWAPTYENYRFKENDGGTELTIEVETTPGYEESLRGTYTKALNLLKELCEFNQ